MLVFEYCLSDVMIGSLCSGVMLQNPDYMKENFVIKIESMHIGDTGDTENVRCNFVFLYFYFIARNVRCSLKENLMTFSS